MVVAVPDGRCAGARAAAGIRCDGVEYDLAAALERLYERCNRREYVAPDPLQFLYGYPDMADREIAGLIASSLAYGRVAQILRSVSIVLDRLGGAPAEFVARSDFRRLRSALRGVRHRFTSGDDIASLLYAAGRAVRKYGSLERCFADGLRPGDVDVLGAASAFVRHLEDFGGRWHDGLLPSPESGSACKRLHLFLRWMVRRDDVDPGGWETVGPEMLIVPVDTHMHRIATEIGLTKRAVADGRAAVEITGAFRRIRPEDPVRYDFVLTRIGIRRDVIWEESKGLYERGAGGMPGRGLFRERPLTVQRRADALGSPRSFFPMGASPGNLRAGREAASAPKLHSRGFRRGSNNNAVAAGGAQ
ncbi:MAG: TIGR02757 family protein [Planctomycetota bacterium]|nr:TIGR02757 family protein [Planctomycetota bacterium]